MSETTVVADPLAQRQFAVGQRVRVLPAHPPGHRRTPAYIRGKVGTIERDCGPFLNPEERAYGFDGRPRRQLYRVRFLQIDVWPHYEGTERDALDVEIYEHWLEAADQGQIKDRS
jgi:nitrile hydratase subunit beta